MDSDNMLSVVSQTFEIFMWYLEVEWTWIALARIY